MSYGKLNQMERSRFDDGLSVLHTLSGENSIVSKPISSSQARNVPDDVAIEIDKIIRQENCHEVYGSLAMFSHSFIAREPNDIDIVVNNPKIVASRIKNVLSKKGYKVKMNCMAQFNSCAVQLHQNGEWIDVVDVHPNKEHYEEYDVCDKIIGRSQVPRRKDGFNVQPANDQVLRKARSVMRYNEVEKRLGAASHRRVKDVTDFIAGSRLMLDSKQLRAEAEMERIKQARRKLDTWKQHLRSLEGYSADTMVGEDPIPENKEREFIQYALDHPDVDLDDIVFTGSGIKHRSQVSTNPFCEFNRPIGKNTNVQPIKPRGKKTKQRPGNLFGQRINEMNENMSNMFKL